jgi:hypothetical protein
VPVECNSSCEVKVVPEFSKAQTTATKMDSKHPAYVPPLLLLFLLSFFSRTHTHAHYWPPPHAHQQPPPPPPPQSPPSPFHYRTANNERYGETFEFQIPKSVDKDTARVVFTVKQMDKRKGNKVEVLGTTSFSLAELLDAKTQEGWCGALMFGSTGCSARDDALGPHATCVQPNSTPLWASASHAIVSV